MSVLYTVLCEHYRSNKSRHVFFQSVGLYERYRFINIMFLTLAAHSERQILHSLARGLNRT